MRHAQLSKIVYFLAISRLAILPVEALTINVQFASGTLFTPTSDAIAKASINAAAVDLGAAITSSLGAVTTDLFSDTVGPSTAQLDWSWDSTDPFTGAVTPHANATSGADTVKIFVDTTLLFGETLGQGGPTIGVSLGGSSTDPSNGFQDALTNVAAQSQTAYTRGGGPVIGTIAGNINDNGFVGSYSVDYGVNYGSAWFDVDTDDSGARDSNSDLEDFWHFNHATAVPNGKNDLYSVALHEMLHVLGIGSSTSWDTQVSGLNWNGSEVQSLVGSGAGLVHNDLSHIAEGSMSVQVTDGDPQEAAMDPDLEWGQRKELTLLDLAFLRDIGFETISPTFPDPPDYDGDGDVDGLDLAFLESSFGLNANGDADNDGDTDGREFLIWQRGFTGPNAITAVPEPTSLLLLACGALALSSRRRVPGTEYRVLGTTLGYHGSRNRRRSCVAARWPRVMWLAAILAAHRAKSEKRPVDRKLSCSMVHSNATIAAPRGIPTRDIQEGLNGQSCQKCPEAHGPHVEQPGCYHSR